MARDSDLIQIVDAAMAEAARKSGAWLACRPGCTPCCIGAFPITMLDAARLRSGLGELEGSDPLRAAEVRRRATEYLARLRAFPGDAGTGVLAGELPDDDEPCPALDPAAGTCDLYAFRPITCRIFGPAVTRGGDAVGVCELCYQGATDEQIAACVVDADPADMERDLLAGDERQTLVAFALLRE